MQAALVKTLVRKRRLPLAVADEGYRVRTECSAQADAVATDGDRLAVVRGAAEAPPVPAAWPLSELTAKTGTVPLGEGAGLDDHHWAIGHEVQVLFTNPADSSDVRGQVTGVLGWNKDPGNAAPDPATGVFLFPVGSPCDDTDGLAPGTYRAIVAVDGAPDEVGAQYGSDAQFAETWFDVGEVTITD